MLQNIGAICANAVGKILLAIIVYFVGKFIIKKLLGLAEKAKGLEKLDPNIRSFTLSAVKWALYVILIVSIIAILGVPMASVVAVLGAAGAGERRIAGADKQKAADRQDLIPGGSGQAESVIDKNGRGKQ